MISEVIFTICCIVAIGGAIAVTLLNSGRRSAIALWVSGLGVGGIYLGVGAEFLAVVQWIVSIMVGLLFVIYSVMFAPRERVTNWMEYVLPFLMGLSFIVVVWMNTQAVIPLDQKFLEEFSLKQLGTILLERHILPFEILGLLLFLVIVGVGANERPSVEESKKR